MKYRCAILDDYQNVALSMADWASLEEQVETTAFLQHFATEDEVVEALQGYQIVVIMRERTPFGKSLFERLPELKLLITSGMRNAAIDLKAASARGVVVCGTGSGSEPPTELTWALLLALARNIVPEATAFARGGPWQSTVGSDLSGCQLGLLGFGKIGTRVAKIAKAFGMKVVAWSQNLKAEVTEPAGVELAPSKESLLASSDFVSIHLVLSDRTRHLIGATEFAQMRPSSYLINTSRAAIVDQEALVQALKTGQIAGAGVDVFDIEPLPVGHPLRNVPNLVATPHLGYVTGRNYRTYFTEAVDDIRAFLAGAPVRKLG